MFCFFVEAICHSLQAFDVIEVLRHFIYFHYFNSTLISFFVRKNCQHLLQHLDLRAIRCTSKCPKVGFDHPLSVYFV